jgi:hypothetical protein
MKPSKLYAAAGAAAALTAFAGSLAYAAAEPTASRSDVYFFADPDTSVGWSSLQRSDNGVVATLSADGVPAGQAVTLWWVVFNDPENCSAPGCGEDDIFVGGDPTADLNQEGIVAADIVAGYGGGTVASADGHILLSVGLGANETGPETLLGAPALLKDAAGAEIHLVVRSHGPAIDGRTDVQTTSYGGGCETDLLPPAVADAEGECVDLLFSVHLP